MTALKKHECGDMMVLIDEEKKRKKSGKEEFDEKQNVHIS